MAPPFRSEDKAESSPDEPKAAVIEPEPAPTKEVSADDYAERCKAELQVGPCRAAFQRWYFNSLTGRCQRFIYGGCKGNKNNYENEESCRSMCTGVTVLPSSKKIPQQIDDEASDYEENCMVTSDPAPAVPPSQRSTTTTKPPPAGPSPTAVVVATKTATTPWRSVRTAAAKVPAILTL
ncbi:kunitz-type protease inhibitor 2-like [Sphaeramia orbicularis]|uniref:kunitz-type protease inhibitor 2-like n=1 Tax=Sphaeramia orbicularis TaxID=375764 RepID=UPI00117D3493|nr:kunitz-type protease inhibitor 2-like [Sphaeramia orbicularis]